MTEPRADDEPTVRADGLVEDEPVVQRLRRSGRRVRTQPDADWQEPGLEQTTSTENDDRLEQDRPPHWG